jgi:hypothetical protein
MRFLLRDHRVGQWIGPVYDRVLKELSAAGVDGVWSEEIPAQFQAGDVFVSHSPIDYREDFETLPVFGLKLVNRRELLNLCDTLGLSTIEWASPDSLESAESLFEEWKTSWLVFKPDSSFARKGIRRWERGTPFPSDTSYDSSADVFMLPNEGDPKTIKVDIFYDKVISSRVFQTLHLESPDFYVPPVEESVQIHDDDQFMRMAELLGPRMVEFGSAYFSVDLMEHRGELRIIEVNPANIGRKLPWSTWPDYIVPKYTRAVLGLLSLGEALPTLREMQANVTRLRESGREA